MITEYSYKNENRYDFSQLHQDAGHVKTIVLHMGTEELGPFWGGALSLDLYRFFFRQISSDKFSSSDFF